MKMSLKAISLTVLLSTASIAFAVDTPFVGKWKLNLAKSKLTGDTVTFASVGDKMRITGGGVTYEFKPDGSDTKTQFGSASWKKIDEKSWEETDTVNGRVDSKNTWTLSEDGKSLAERSTGDKPGGGSFDDTSVFVRTAGTKGLTGTWKDKEFKGSAPSLLIISDTDNGLHLQEPDFKLEAMAKFDGKPGSVEGPSIPSGASFTLSRSGSHSFKMIRTQNGKPFDSSTWTAAPDGKSLVVVSRTAGTNDPPTTEFFERQ